MTPPLMTSGMAKPSTISPKIIVIVLPLTVTLTKKSKKTVSSDKKATSSHPLTLKPSIPAPTVESRSKLA